MIPGMGVYKYKGVGVRFSDFIKIKYPRKMKLFGLN